MKLISFQTLLLRSLTSKHQRQQSLTAISSSTTFRSPHSQIRNAKVQKAARLSKKPTQHKTLGPDQLSLLNGSSALANAAEVQYTAIVGMLLEKRPAVSNSHYNSREGALCIAAERGYQEIGEMILEKGIREVMEEEMGDRSPLCRAAENGKTAIVKRCQGGKLCCICRWCAYTYQRHGVMQSTGHEARHPDDGSK
jgi:hypothetical protein